MQVGTEGVTGISHTISQGLGHGGRRDAGYADPPQIRDVVQCVRQVHNVAPITVVGADIDAGQDQLANPSCGGGPGLLEGVFPFAGTGTPAGEGNDAETAHEIAAVLDLQVGPLVKGQLTHEVMPEILPADAVPQDDRAFVLAVAEVVQHGELILVTDDEVDSRDLGNDGRTHLRIATDHRRESAGIFPCKLTDGLAAFGIGLPGHGAGVDDTQISRLTEGNHSVPRQCQPIFQNLRFSLVQPATEGVNHGPTTGLTDCRYHAAHSQKTGTARQ